MTRRIIPHARARALALVVAVSFLAAACGVDAGRAGRDPSGPGATPTEPAKPGDGEDDDREALQDQMTELLPLGEGAELERAELECVEREGEDRDIDLERVFTDASAAGKELRIEVVDLVIGCIEDPATSPWMLAAVRASLHTPALPSISDDEARCAADAVLATPEPARALLGELSPTSAVFEAMLDCLTPAHRSALTLEEGTGPQERGDDERLDALADDCEGGDPRACDLLYLNTSEGSGYEEIALACGGAELTEEGFCAPESRVDETGAAPPDHPGLAVLAEDCQGGDLTACDLLYIIAPVGSDFERIGSTCGGRIAIGAVPDCRTRFG